jgi:hypothetical protein
MAKQKASGLGRGLGDLLEDNTPEIKTSTARVIIRKPDGDRDMKSTTSDLYEKDKKPKNRSVLSNYR